MLDETADGRGAFRLLTQVETATIGHFRTEGFLPPAIQCLSDGTRVCGPAFTVSLPGDDGTALSYAVSRASPGDMLVVARENDDRHACWGAVLTAAAQFTGIVGVVIDGFVTDVGAIRASGLPVWCRGRSPLTTKMRGGGTIGEAVRIGDVVICPGDIVLGDESGIFTAPAAEAADIAGKALALQEKEPSVIARLKRGETLLDIYMLR